MLIVMHAKHPLAEKTVAVLQQFSSDAFVCTHRNVGVGFYSITLALCEAAGFVPRIEVFSSQTSILISMVAAGFGVALVPASAQTFNPPDVMFQRLRANSVKSVLSIAYMRNNRSPFMGALLTVRVSGHLRKHAAIRQAVLS